MSLDDVNLVALLKQGSSQRYSLIKTPSPAELSKERDIFQQFTSISPVDSLIWSSSPVDRLADKEVDHFPAALQKLPQHSLRYSLLQQSLFEGTSPVEFIPQQRCFPIEVGTSAEVFPQQIIWSIVPQRSLFLPYNRTPQQFFLQGSNPQSRLFVLEAWSDSASEDYGWIYFVFANRLSTTHKHSLQALQFTSMMATLSK